MNQVSKARARRAAAAWLGLALAGLAAGAEPPVLPPGDKAPVLKIEAGGPTAFVTSLAFSPDGRTLYAAGWDKVVRTWALKKVERPAPGEPAETFVLTDVAYRVPLGRGSSGAINALALSDDGAWLAVGGSGPFRGGISYRGTGLVLPVDGRMTPAMWKDRGLIYLFDTRTGAVRLLRGTPGEIFSLAFAPSRPGAPARLLSAGREIKESGERVGSVRLWDVDGAKYLDGRFLPNVDGGWRPSLAAWNDPTRGSLQVALGWGDGPLRVWDVGGDRLRPRTPKTPLTKFPVAYFPGEDTLLMAVYGRDKVRLHPWQAAPAGEVAPKAPVEAMRAKGVPLYPRALGLVSDRADGRPNLAAVVTLQAEKKVSQFGLQLLDLRDDHFGKVRAEVPLLWRGSNKLPALATAPRGRYLAVAGNDDHSILVYAVEDLLGGKLVPQRLNGVGTAMHYAGFVRKGQALGLLLNESERQGKKEPGQAARPPRAGDMVFDLAGRRLTRDLAGWKTDTPDPATWGVEQPDPAKPVLKVSDGNRLTRTIKLPDGEVITDFVLLPPRPPLGRPILAVASHDRGQPRLALYDARSGERFRELVAHTDRIYCLAFSGDGRLLVSAAEDQTVCVWSVAAVELQKVLGRHGMIPGLAVRTEDGRVVVARLDADSPAREKLSAGDVIRGLVVGGDLHPLATARDFYEAINLLTPGQPVTLQVGDRNVTLTVGQAVDERKPLFSLFVTHDGKPEERDWIGWDPIGPYDASSAEAERHLGWHFNTGDPANPTRFGFIDQYHKEYYRKGILGRLAADGRRIPRPPPPPPDPVLVPWVEDGGAVVEAGADGQRLTRRATVTLRVQVKNRPPNTLKAVTWQVDGGKPRRFPPSADGGPDLADAVTLTHDVHTLRVAAQADDPRSPGTSREFPGPELKVRYQPPAPEIPAEKVQVSNVKEGRKAPAGKGRRWDVTQRDIRLSALVTADAGAAVRLTHTYEGKTLAQASDPPVEPGKARTVEHNFTLEPGLNVIELEATNRDALKGYEDQETTRLVVEVNYIEVKVKPAIMLTVRPKGADEKDARRVEGPRPLRVAVPVVRITARVTAADALARAAWGPDAALREAAGYDPAKPARTATVEADVNLKPGEERKFVFRAATDTSKAELPVTLAYRPPTPTAEVTEPRAGRTVDGTTERGEVDVKARLSAPAELMRGEAEEKDVVARMPKPQAVVLVNDRAVEAAPRIDGATLTAKVPLTPGDNQIQVRLTYDWDRRGFTSDPVAVRYERPPVVRKLTGPAKTTEPRLDVEAEVFSPLPPLPASVRLEINGRAYRPARGQVKIVSKPGDVYVLTVAAVPLEPGERRNQEKVNKVRLWVSNREAEGRKPGEWTVAYTPRKEPPAVRFLDYRGNLTVDGPPVKVRYHVHSDSKLRRVALEVEGGEAIPFDLRGARPDRNGEYDLMAEAELKKLPLVETVVSAVAEDDAGLVGRTEPLIISYPGRPVPLVLDGFTSAQNGNGADVIRPQGEEPDGTLRFPRAPTARLMLWGHVECDPKDDAVLREVKVVRVFVNGFQQLPAPLLPQAAGSRVRRFKTPVLLNQEKDNHITVVLAKAMAGSRTQAVMDCADPARARRLHLLVLSRRRVVPDRLRQQVLKAFDATPDPQDPGRFTTPNFREGYFYGPFTARRVSPEYLHPQLVQIRNTIELRANRAAPGTDLVVFYYQGREVIDATGHLFESDLTVEGDDGLEKFFADTPGAHVLLFEVDRDPGGAAGPEADKIGRWEKNFPRAANVALLRYAWLSPADAPRDPRLMKDLEAVIPRAGPLGDVMDLMHKAAEQSPSFAKSLPPKEYVPADMRNIPFGRPR